MIVTVMTDASHCHKTNASAWGIWVKSNRGKIHCGGNFKSLMTSSYEAEAKAIAIGVYMALKSGLAMRGDKIILQTDCMLVKSVYEGGVHKSNLRYPTIVEGVSKARKLAKKHGCLLEVRWVKAHTPKKGTRNAVNEMCDQIAKQYMRKQRAEIERAA